jgi:hypothetical protein
VEEPRFLPPEPPGPEPDLSESRVEQQAPPPPPPPQQTYGYPPPPPGHQAPPPGWGQPPQWAWQPPVPDNGQAVVGFVFSVVGIGLLVISFGLSSIVSVGCAITGIVCSRNGKRKVERGETPKHKGLAQAGYIVGWVGLALSMLATAGWIVAIATGAIDEGSGGSGTPAHLRTAVAIMVGG